MQKELNMNKRTTHFTNVNSLGVWWKKHHSFHGEMDVFTSLCYKTTHPMRMLPLSIIPTQETINASKESLTLFHKSLSGLDVKAFFQSLYMKL